MKYLAFIGLLWLVFYMDPATREDSLAHSVFIYEKSNIDGTNLGKIAVYYEEKDQLESFKWHEGNQYATIVRAQMDTILNTVKRFEVYRTDHEGNSNLGGVLKVGDDQVFDIQFGENIQQYKNMTPHWHSYDFDFASLGYAFRSFPKKKSISFNILDVDMNQDPPKFGDFGEVEMKFIGEEKKYSRKLLKYAIDGQGLDHRGGHIWFDKQGGYLVAFEIQKPDERGYDSGKLVLKEVLKIDKKGWDEFKKEALRP